MKKIKPTYLKCVLRSELVALMKANGIKSNYHEPALILNQALYWSERVSDVADMLDEERKRDGAECEPTDCMHGWIYKSAEVWIEDTMLGISVNTMRRHLLILEQFGYLMSRSNPKNKWDKVLQYRINLIKIMQDLEGIGFILNGYSALSKYQDTSPNCQVGASECLVEGAILESILENNLETLKTKIPAPKNGTGGGSKTENKKPFALNFETDVSARLLKYFHDEKGLALTNDIKSLEKQWQCVRKWVSEAKDHNKKEDVRIIEDRVKLAIIRALKIFREGKLSDKGIYSYSPTVMSQILKIRGEGQMELAKWD